MITLTLFQVSTLITALVSLLLGIFVYSSGEKTKLNFSWLLTSIFISLWSIGLFGVVFSTNADAAWFWQYVLDISGICVPVLFFNFILYLIKKDKELFILQITSFIAGTALIILNFTNLFKTGVSPKFGINFWVDPGKLYFLFPLYFTLFVIIPIYIVIKEYRISTDKNQKVQLMYVLMAQIFGFGGGFTDFFPQLFNVYPFGNYFVILYVIFISYAALKHHLFDVKVIATELFTFALGIILFIKIFSSIDYQDLLFNVGIFLSVVLFGMLLIRGVLKEVKQREEMELMAGEVKKAYEVEKRAKEELEALGNVKNQFLMTIQHHLRTPLTSMRGYADLLLNGSYGKVPKKIEEVVKKFEVSTTSLIKMVNDFLDITQFQLGKEVISLKDGVNLAPILDEIIKDMELEAKKKGIYLKYDKSKGDCIIKADESKLKAALVNIFDNSVKYTKEGGVEIKLKTDPSTGSGQGEKIKIEIKDTGMGIAKERLPKLFDSTFERTEEAKKTFVTGRGIGLYLSSQIIKAHNGKIWAESEGEGKGSTFFIELPVAG